MFAFLSDFFQKKGIFLFAPIHLEDCCLKKPYLLERAGIKNGTAVMFAVPYLSPDCLQSIRNISLYAAPRDYHGFFSELFDELIPLLTNQFPNNRFAGFADHSPIAEVDAAARAGLGVIGKNSLLITEAHSSFVFLGSLITDALLPTRIVEPQTCIGCGKCKQSCPMNDGGVCLSSLTQKKGMLSPEEEAMVQRHRSAWGCDLCQLCCPHTQKAIKSRSIFTSIPYFLNDTLPYLSSEALSQMSDADFSARAYSWRGKATIARNLQLLERGQTPC